MKFEFEKEIIAAIKTRIPSIPDTDVDKKLRGVQWKKTKSNTVLLIKGTYDETIFIGGEEGFEQEYTTEKSLVLADVYTYIENTYAELDKEVNASMVKFELIHDKAVYTQIYGEWIDLIIRRNHFGVPPLEPMKIIGLTVRQFVDVKVPAVSDKKNFLNKEDIKNIEERLAEII